MRSSSSFGSVGLLGAVCALVVCGWGCPSAAPPAPPSADGGVADAGDVEVAAEVGDSTDASPDVSDGCASDDECGPGEACILELAVCVVGCRDDAACGPGRICEEAAALCVEGCREDAECGAGRVCDEATRACVGACLSSSECPGREQCSPEGRCVPGCSEGSCPEGSGCVLATGQCVEGRCEGGVRGCDDPSLPNWDERTCSCVECVLDRQCGGRVCREGECTDECATACNPRVPGACSGGTPYCIDGCCVTCLTDDECASDQICEGGACTLKATCIGEEACAEGFSCVGTRCERTCACRPIACDVGGFCVPCAPPVDARCGTLTNQCVDGRCV